MCPDNHEPTNAPNVQTWKKCDLNSHLELLLHMEDTLKQSVRTLTTTKQIWDTLEANYLHTDFTSQVGNLKTLVNMNMNENDDIDVFVQNLKLHFMMCSFHDLVCQNLLATLPPSWQLFISKKSGSANISVPTLVASISQKTYFVGL